MQYKLLCCRASDDEYDVSTLPAPTPGISRENTVPVTPVPLPVTPVPVPVTPVQVPVTPVPVPVTPVPIK